MDKEILRRMSAAFHSLGKPHSHLLVHLFCSLKAIGEGWDQGCFNSQELLSTLSFGFRWLTSLLSGFRQEKGKGRMANKKQSLFTVNNLLGAFERRCFDFTTFTSRGFEYKIVKEKSETDTNVCFSKCQDGGTMFTFFSHPSCSLPLLPHLTAPRMSKDLFLPMARNVTLMFSKCQGFLPFDGGAI